jgi:hypothetical protein
MEEGGIDVSSEMGIREYFEQDDINNYNRNSIRELKHNILPRANLEALMRQIFSIPRTNEIGLRNRDTGVYWFIDKFVPETQPILKGGKYFKKYKKSIKRRGKKAGKKITKKTKRNKSRKHRK